MCRGSVADEPRELPLTAASQAYTSVDDVLDAFLARAECEDSSAPPSLWGDKVGFSIYDEEEIFGRFEWRCPGMQALREVLEQEAQAEEDENEEDSDFSDGEESQDDFDIFCESLGGGAYVEQPGTPRAVKLIRPLCYTYALDQDLAEECPVCLESLSRGQDVWRLPCTHVVHDMCMIRFLKVWRMQVACPICRCNIKCASAASPPEICPHATTA